MYHGMPEGKTPSQPLVRLILPTFYLLFIFIPFIFCLCKCSSAYWSKYFLLSWHVLDNSGTVLESLSALVLLTKGYVNYIVYIKLVRMVKLKMGLVESVCVCVLLWVICVVDAISVFWFLIWLFLSLSLVVVDILLSFSVLACSYVFMD